MAVAELTSTEQCLHAAARGEAGGLGVWCIIISRVSAAEIWPCGTGVFIYTACGLLLMCC